MKTLTILLFLSATLLATVEAGASRFWLIDGGTNGTNNSSSIVSGTGRTQGGMNLLPLSAEFSLKSTFDSIPLEPYTTKKLNNSPKVGHLFESGINLNDDVPNLTLQLGGGDALQSAMNYATSMESGTHWQKGSRDTESQQVGYVGFLYRLNSIHITAGYNAAGEDTNGYKNQRGVVLGIGMSW